MEDTRDTAQQLESQDNEGQEAQQKDPEGQGRMFTAEEVDEIVRRRLARDRRARAGENKDGDDHGLAEREAALNARELNLMAREVLIEEGMPTKLADILNYSDEKTLRKMIEELKFLNPGLTFGQDPNRGKAWGERQGRGRGNGPRDAATRQAMGLKG